MDSINKKRRRTIQARIAKQKKEFLEQIKKTPIVQIACEKAFISRATIYRWRDNDKEFGETMDKALHEGKLMVNDVAESQLMAAIRDRNMSAIIFWLKHHHKEYTTRVEINARINQVAENLTPDQEKIVREALRLAALTDLDISSPENNDNEHDSSGSESDPTNSQ